MWVILFTAVLLVLVVAMARLGTKDARRPLVRRGRRKRNDGPGRGGKSWWAGGSGSAGGGVSCGGGSSCGSGCGGGCGGGGS